MKGRRGRNEEGEGEGTFSEKLAPILARFREEGAVPSHKHELVFGFFILLS
jgi:hypothetical protein